MLSRLRSLGKDCAKTGPAHAVTHSVPQTSTPRDDISLPDPAQNP